MWLVLIRKKGKVNKRAIVLCLNPVYIGANSAFPISVYKRATVIFSAYLVYTDPKRLKLVSEGR